MAPPYNTNDLLVKPTYDVAFYGEDLHLPLGVAPLNYQDVDWGNLTQLLTVDSDIENYSRVISDSDALGILNEGNGVGFDHTYNWLSDVSAWVYKYNITMAVALNVTAWTSGDHVVSSARIILTERLPDGTLLKTMADETKNTGMTVLNGSGRSVVIMTFENDKPFKITQGNTVRLQVILGRTDTMVATSFEGIMPLFYFQTGTGVKQLIESTMNLHLYPALDQAFTVFRDQSLQEPLDYSGVTKQGVSRQHEAINAPLPEIDPPFEGNLEDLPHAHFPTSRPIGIE